MSPSIYETARLVSTARWLDGHQERLLYLLEQQRQDGSWGGPDGYALVPTLSVVEAFLVELSTGNRLRDRIHISLARGISWLRRKPGSIPDTIAAELIVPWLVEEINQHLDHRLNTPSQFNRIAPHRLREAARKGSTLPAKLWHSLEVLGADAALVPVRPVNGTVGGSAAATAAWLSGREGAGPDARSAIRHLDALQQRGGGPVPGVSPISVFERAWVVSALADGSIAIPTGLVESLHGALGEHGASAGAGLPTDSDDTAGVLYALAKAGRPASPASLWEYESTDHFQCFPGERTPSTSTNAHIMDALLLDTTEPPARRRAALTRIAAWLCGQQTPEGCWWDKWHASPYYATVCCALALHRTGGRRSAVGAAIRWVLDNQRPDGSWGRWTGTVEETAYAVQTLLATARTPTSPVVAEAAARGCAFLVRADRAEPANPPLWHDKDLYTPAAVVSAARLAALRMFARHPEAAAHRHRFPPCPRPRRAGTAVGRATR
ncbi:hypothetical protein BKA01_005084 [Pseudonocardia eucalypti]|uniref:prenyltransferase/squalene oxidase repeat-containing protein n=1 Tax=Pseudonocardia eucalypti TaxID=648755 RepID=UPI0018511F87|nr:hypothetical protein [Pseudonocardia eucalypti]